MSLCLAFLASYSYFHFAAPFPGKTTDLLTNGMVTLASVSAAVMGVRVWRRYGKSTPPRGIWWNFMAALWGWAIAELIWLFEYAIGGEALARFSIADVFWVVSYVFFLSALLRQYLLIYRPQRIISASYLILSLVASLMFTFLYAIWLANTNNRPLDLNTLVHTFYPIGDFALALGALLLAVAFRDGALGRPWLGLLVFAFSDLMYSLLEASGLYAWSVVGGNLLTTITDVIYMAAYIAIAFGCYLQYLLLSYGPRLKI
jgi:hypothetical protein